MTQQTQFQHKPGYGAIFSNKEAKQDAGEAGEKWPDVQGQGCCPHCQETFDLAAWWRKAKNTGAQYLSLSIRPPRENTQAGQPNVYAFSAVKTYLAAHEDDIEAHHQNQKVSNELKRLAKSK